jgi:hypothetical protein
MNNALLLLVLAFVIGIGDFLLGLWVLRISRRPKSEWPSAFNASAAPAQLALLGRALMIGGPVFFLALTAFAFGLFGPVQGFTPLPLQ